MEDGCKDVVCGNVCAMDKDGPKCLCDDGVLAKDGMCPVLDKKFVSIKLRRLYDQKHSLSKKKIKYKISRTESHCR